MLVTHGSDEAGLAALWRHERRWAVTVRTVVPKLHVGNIMVMPLPLALLGALAHPLPGTWLVGLALLSRLALATTVDRRTGLKPLAYSLLPLRDLIDFAVFITSFFTRSVDWRGAQLRMMADGRVAAVSETAHS